MMITNSAEAPRKPLGLYLHIPFCVNKCRYCDFLSFGDASKEKQEDYFTALIQEINGAGTVYHNEYYVDTLFIGGGTPSLVEASFIEAMILSVRNSFNVAEAAEISIESNPGTLTAHKLNIYRNAGINRLSIGAQSFSEKLLDSLGRIHSANDVLKNYTLARACGFQNINLDLMFGIPGQTMDIWMDTVQRTMELEPEHISFYSLQIEENTPFFDLFQKGALQVTDEELDRDMYHRALKKLKENEYLHYEISNASKKGHQCRHNLKYWSMEDYLGLGLGAHSYIEGTRFSNQTELNEYIKTGRRAERGDFSVERSPYEVWRHKNTLDENVSEYLFTGMRKIKGIKLSDFKERFGEDLHDRYGEIVRAYMEKGLLETEKGYLRFTEKGIDISNTVLAEFV